MEDPTFANNPSQVFVFELTSLIQIMLGLCWTARGNNRSIRWLPVHQASGDSLVSCGNYKTCSKYLQQFSSKPQPQYSPWNTWEGTITNLLQIMAACIWELSNDSSGFFIYLFIFKDVFQSGSVVQYCCLSGQQRWGELAQNAKITVKEWNTVLQQFGIEILNAFSVMSRKCSLRTSALLPITQCRKSQGIIKSGNLSLTYHIFFGRRFMRR